MNRILILIMALTAGCSSFNPNASTQTDSLPSVVNPTPESKSDQQFDTTGFF